MVIRITVMTMISKMITEKTLMITMIIFEQVCRQEERQECYNIPREVPRQECNQVMIKHGKH